MEACFVSGLPPENKEAYKMSALGKLILVRQLAHTQPDKAECGQQCSGNTKKDGGLSEKTLHKVDVRESERLL